MNTTATITDTVGFAPPPGYNKQFAEGIIRIRRIPDTWSEAEYKYWWCPETDGKGTILRPARISEREKQELEICVHTNQIMNAGRRAVLSYIGSSSGSTTAWSQYFAIGTGSISSTSPTDTSLSNEVFRKAPASFAVNGTAVDINIQLGTTEAEYTYTDCGLFGNGATATLSSGSLYTHALFSYVKGAYAVSVDYLVNLL